ncbi:hypothetical protein HMI54_015751 [Coelomomyces lativittatus]|nr:hypothetical protein HMI55_004418 [Coelomomyces lativittatus]KAJ1510493.1 hypothetical protein HMI56_006315 [Coelomomyces lativittatus]KAJ1512383.1 hypothetical protein HMI54_015751 [Coelomomyces lativittatus]
MPPSISSSTSPLLSPTSPSSLPRPPLSFSSSSSSSTKPPSSLPSSSFSTTHGHGYVHGKGGWFRALWTELRRAWWQVYLSTTSSPKWTTWTRLVMQHPLLLMYARSLHVSPKYLAGVLGVLVLHLSWQVPKSMLMVFFLIPWHVPGCRWLGTMAALSHALPKHPPFLTWVFWGTWMYLQSTQPYSLSSTKYPRSIHSLSKENEEDNDELQGGGVEKWIHLCYEWYQKQYTLAKQKMSLEVLDQERFEVVDDEDKDGHSSLTQEEEENKKKDELKLFLKHSNKK